jgi:hypothetical protein
MIRVNLPLILAADPVAPVDWTQYGVLGVVASFLLWFAVTVWRQTNARANAAEAEVRRLNQVIQDRHIPALEASVQANRELIRFLERERDRRRNGGG